MEKQRPKQEGQIGFRVPKELRTRLDRIHERHLTSDAGVFRALAEAFCDEAEKQQRVALPLKVQFAETAVTEDAARWSINEGAAESGPTKKSAKVGGGKKP